MKELRMQALELLTTEELLQTRICDLEVSIDETPALEKAIVKFYGELDNQGFEYFKPRVYLGDEWFSPEGVPAIAIPFYLAHPVLRKLERSTMGKVEGGTQEWCLRLLRHEAGHCFDHAYQVSRSAEWKQLFGNRRKKYNPHYYKIDPKSRDFVHNLEDHYAQSHPDEDFAETFAVWLDPQSNWQIKYRNWPKALKKLKYIDRLVRELKLQRPRVNGGRLLGQASILKSSLSRYYKRRIKEGSH